MRVEIVLTPTEIAGLPHRDLRGATCVVFDVLRATSTLLTAFAHGARRIHPVRTVEAARELRSTHLPDALLGGERQGARIDGFDLGNSPLEYTADRVGGRDIVMTTTNGTRALQACAGADAVHAGALLNLDALAAALNRADPPPRTLLLVCAGTGEHFALEDGWAAAALLARLHADPPASDAGQLLAAWYRAAGDSPLGTLQASRNGRHLAEIGQAGDVEYCAQVARLDVLATMQAGVLQRVATDGTPV